MQGFAYFSFAFILLIPNSAYSNPYFDPSQIKKIIPQRTLHFQARAQKRRAAGLPIMRVQVDWNPKTEAYTLAETMLENSGTEALERKVKKPDPHGSYQAALFDLNSKKAFAFQSIGTGKEFRKLTRAMTFRFPKPKKPVLFKMKAENPKTGEMELVIEEAISPADLKPVPAQAVTIRRLKKATQKPSLVFGIYAEGYHATDKKRFWVEAEKVVEALSQSKFPKFERFEINAIFAPSKKKLGKAKDLGLPVQERDSFLGLYHPYWNKFGRWYHVVYPTREKRYRDGLAQAQYDHPIILIDSREYWGVGNFGELTAIPSRSPHFVYLLLHEIGHYFGLNEEYTGGGPTELEFAPGIKEPWSQNITFQTEYSKIKWRKFISDSTPVPTPNWHWKKNPPRYGAYKGGYADSEPKHKSHIPGRSCVMERAPNFCQICRFAIQERIKIDLGL